MEKGVKYTIAIKAVHIENVEHIPDVEVVSAFYWVFSSHKFLKQVDLQIRHCAQLMEKSEISRMGIVTARCDEGLPYRFRKIKSDRCVFELQSRQALVSTRYFSFFAAVRDWLYSPSRPDDTLYVYIVFGKKIRIHNVWHFDFYFLKDIEPLIKV